MKRSRSLAVLLIYLTSLVLAMVLAGGIAGADGVCEDNYPAKASPTPKPQGPVAQLMWREASLYANVRYEGGQVRYVVCHPWR